MRETTSLVDVFERPHPFAARHTSLKGDFTIPIVCEIFPGTLLALFKRGKLQRQYTQGSMQVGFLGL